MEKIVNLDEACKEARNNFLASVKGAITTLTAEFERHGCVSRTKEFHLSKTPSGSHEVVGSVEYKDKLSTHELKLDVEFHHNATVSIMMVLFKNMGAGGYVSVRDFSHVKIKGEADDILNDLLKNTPDYVSLIETGKVPTSIGKILEEQS